MSNLVKYYLVNGQPLDDGVVEPPAGWEVRMMIPTTHLLHRRHEQKLIEQHSPILYRGRLTFSMVAECAGVHRSTVAYWYQLTPKFRLNPELLALCQYYQAPFRHAFCWKLQDGSLWAEIK